MLITINTAFAFIWLKKLWKNTFKTLTYQQQVFITVSPLFGNKVKTNPEINLIGKKKKDLVTSDDEILPKLITIQNACHIRKTENIQKKKKSTI